MLSGRKDISLISVAEYARHMLIVNAQQMSVERVNGFSHLLMNPSCVQKLHSTLCMPGVEEVVSEGIWATANFLLPVPMPEISPLFLLSLT